MSLKFLLSEKFFVLAITFAAILFNIFPYLYEQNVKPDDKTYVGSFPVLLDKPTYLAEMTQGESGNWKMFNRYTTETQDAVFLFPFYLSLGHIAKSFNASVETTFFISRFIFGAVFLLTVIYFIRYFVHDKIQRIIAYFFLYFSSGLGWITLNQGSLDLWSPGFMPIVRFFYFPHMMLANTLLLAVFLLIYKFFESKNLPTLIWAGIAALVLSAVLPFHSFLFYPIVLVFLLIFSEKKMLKISKIYNAMIFLLISAPYLIYLVHIGNTNPVWMAVKKAAVLESGFFIDFVSGLGLLFLFSLIGLYIMYRNKVEYFSLFFIWIFSIMSLPYLTIFPIQQRRILETGIYVPLAITASFGIMGVYRYLKEKRIKDIELKFVSFFTIFVIPFMMMGNVFNWLQFKQFINKRDDPRIYLPNENIEAMKWLRKNSAENSIVLASFYNGNVIPYYADRVVYAGHGPLTINLEEKLRKIENFYSGKYSGNEVFNFLKKERVDYVLFTDEEKKLGDFHPEKIAGLKTVYSNSKATIYKVE